VVDLLAVHHTVEELGDVGVQGERGHPAPADELRVDRARRPGPHELVLGVDRARSRDDHEVGSQGTGGQRRVGGVRVRVEGADQGAGVLDAGSTQDVVVGGVTDDDVKRALGQPLGVTVDDDDRVSRVEEVTHGGGPDPPEATDDDVPAQPGDVVFHAKPSKVLEQTTLGDGLEDHPQVVEHDPDTDDDEQAGEEHEGRGAFVDLGVADRGHREHRLVDRLDEGQPEKHVADGAEDRHRDEGRERSPDPTDAARRAAAEQQRARPETRRRTAHDAILAPGRRSPGGNAL
jgi:hypothetical protein